MRLRISRDRSAVALTIMLVVFTAAHVVLALRSGLSVYPDSARYLDQSVSDLLDPRQPGPLTGLAYMIVGSQGVVPLQFVLGYGAGVAFVYAVYRLIGNWAGWILATVAGCYLLRPEFRDWHSVALTESLSLSLMLAWLAAVLLLLSYPPSRSFPVRSWPVRLSWWSWSPSPSRGSFSLSLQPKSPSSSQRGAI